MDGCDFMNQLGKGDLAVNGGVPVISREFVVRNTMGPEEEQAAVEVIRSGVLSRFQGSAGDDFLGGPQVRAFEEEWADYFGVHHAISVNSWTSGLIAIVGALEIEPGDEVLVTPWTMSASATAIMQWNAIPIFVDIDRASFCLDPSLLEQHITPQTRAIMSVDIFGQSASMEAINAIAAKHGLSVISDCAQAPGAWRNGRRAGTLGTIGGYSLNRHKHVHTGEGGMIVTDDPDLALRTQLIRNHGEAVVDAMGITAITNILGFNFRLGEIEAAIGRCQLRRLESQTSRRTELAEMLNEGLGELMGLKTPQVTPGNDHVYYMYGLQVDPEALGVTRDWIYRALTAEGVQGLGQQYTNIHRLPMYTQRTAFGSKGFPWSLQDPDAPNSYGLGACPVAEDLQERTYLGLELCSFAYTDTDITDTVNAFKKVWSYIGAAN
jgi:dTDP-4-amino-4,6-dideoxygalactose transaminase